MFEVYVSVLAVLPTCVNMPVCIRIRMRVCARVIGPGDGRGQGDEEVVRQIELDDRRDGRDVSRELGQPHVAQEESPPFVLLRVLHQPPGLLHQRGEKERGEREGEARVRENRLYLRIMRRF